MAKKKILLLGGTGMAGHMVYYYLQNTGRYDMMNVVYRTKLTNDSIVLDVTNRDAVIKVIHEENPDIIINCIGILIKGSTKYPDNAIYINAYFPHLLKKISDNIDAKLIHISTDCVFSGKKGNYSETAFRDADDIYGRSKALGEIVSDKDLTIRTSIIGPELKEDGEGLFHWFMHQQGSISGYRNAIWGGVTTLELAKAIANAIETETVGLIHLSNGTGISKYDLLNMVKKIWNKNDINIFPKDDVKVDKSIKRSSSFSYDVPDYEVMLNELHRWMNSNKIYNNNYTK